MIIAVLIKHVPDTASVLTISDDGKSLVLNGLKFVMNPYDEFAAEEAILLRERLGGEVVAVCAGPPESKETIRTALAMGVDSGLLISGTEQLAGRGLSMALAAGLATLSQFWSRLRAAGPQFRGAGGVLFRPGTFRVRGGAAGGAAGDAARVVR